MRKFYEEFKAFIMRGNVLDMAVGVIIASSFGKITTSLVNDVFMPLISFIVGSTNMTALNILVRPAQLDESGKIVKEAITIGLGSFLGTVVDFILVAFVVFIILKSFNKVREMTDKHKKEAEAASAEEAPAGPTTEQLLAQILETIQKKDDA